MPCVMVGIVSEGVRIICGEIMQVSVKVYIFCLLV